MFSFQILAIARLLHDTSILGGRQHVAPLRCDPPLREIAQDGVVTVYNGSHDEQGAE
jgi:hypothetical protein